MKELIQKAIKEFKQFKQDASGELSAAAWALGGLVLVVVIILALKAIAPDTATNLWNVIWQWVTDQFGIN